MWLRYLGLGKNRRGVTPELCGDAAHAAVKENGRKSFCANCQEIDSMFQGIEWIMGSEFTLVDPYTLVFYGWSVRGGFPMKDLSDHAVRLSRDSV